MSDLHRLNIEIIDGQVCICFDLHEKGQPCEYEPQSPEQIVKLLNSAGRQIFQLKQRIEQLERERNEYRDKWIRKCKELDIVDEQLAQRDIEQQEKGVNHVGAMLTGMGFDGVESLCEKAIEQLRKGGE